MMPVLEPFLRLARGALEPRTAQLSLEKPCHPTSEPTMTWFDHSRRAVSVLLVVLCLVAAPAVATAQFTGTRTAGANVGTDRMETPSSFVGSYRCTRSGGTEYLEVTINSFTDDGPSGATYGYGLAIGTSIKDAGWSGSKTQTLNGSRSHDGQSTTWAVGIQAWLQQWYGGIGTKEIVCPSSGNKTGTF
jgi:hypothetical protein